MLRGTQKNWDRTNTFARMALCQGVRCSGECAVGDVDAAAQIPVESSTNGPAEQVLRGERLKDEKLP